MSHLSVIVPAVSPVLYAVPEGVIARGTVVVAPGRGESAAVYTRLATRLALDAYRVLVLDSPPPTVEALIALLHEHSSAGAAPLVLIGADTGAIAALDVAAAADTPVDGVVLAGTPVPAPAADVTASWAEELDTRTACPVHRGWLSADPKLLRGALLREPVPVWPAPRSQVPALVLHGAADRISPLREIRGYLRGAVQRLSVVAGGRHDVLNDVQHRSVAAEIVQFLEALREDPSARPVLSEVTL